MKPELARRLAFAATKELAQNLRVTPVTPVTAFPVTGANQLELQGLQALQAKNSKLPKREKKPVTAPVTIVPELDEAELEERKGMAMGAVPEIYLDAWARLQVQKPVRVSDDEWGQAINDAGRFLDAWGELAAELQWTPDDLFAVPRDGRPGGLVWRLQGDSVEAFGPGPLDGKL